MSIPREKDLTIHLLKMAHDPAYREAHQGSETIASLSHHIDSKAKARADVATMCVEARKSKAGESSELDKATLHLIKMKYDSEYAAAYNAGDVKIEKTLAKPVITSTITEQQILKSTDGELTSILAKASQEEMELILKSASNAEAILYRIRQLKKAKT